MPDNRYRLACAATCSRTEALTEEDVIAQHQTRWLTIKEGSDDKSARPSGLLFSIFGWIPNSYHRQQVLEITFNLRRSDDEISRIPSAPTADSKSLAYRKSAAVASIRRVIGCNRVQNLRQDNTFLFYSLRISRSDLNARLIAASCTSYQLSLANAAGTVLRVHSRTAAAAKFASEIFEASMAGVGHTPGRSATSDQIAIVRHCSAIDQFLAAHQMGSTTSNSYAHCDRQYYRVSPTFPVVAATRAGMIPNLIDRVAAVAIYRQRFAASVEDHQQDQFFGKWQGP